MTGFTALGSLPGTDYGAALRMTFDRMSDVAPMPELPARGPWAAMIGRALGLPSGLPADFGTGTWRLAAASGIDQRRARATWRDDLDQLEEEAGAFTGVLKLAVAGPWTLSAAVGIAHTGRVLADRGARRDLAQSLAASVGELLAEVARRLPGARLVLQLDEPSLPAVAAGAVPTPGGYFRHAAVDLPEIVAALAGIADAARPTAVQILLHSCAPWTGPGDGWPIADLLSARGARLDGLSYDIDQLTDVDLDALGLAAETGAALYLGVLPTSAPPLRADPVAQRCVRLWERIGRPPIDRLVLTPACGLARWSAAEVSAGLESLRIAAMRLDERAAD